jgi:predicted deacylase
MIEIPTKSEHIANMLSGNGSSTLKATVRAVAYRCPIELLGTVDAMAAKAKKSRNAMLNLLVEAGVAAVRSDLSDEVVLELSATEYSYVQALLGESSDEQIEE